MIRNFKALPFKSYCADLKRKFTRKKHDIEILNSDYFPPEGHVSCKIDDCNVIFFGGNRKSEDISSNEIVKINFDIEDDDVSVNFIKKLKTYGAVFPPLQGSAAVSIPDSQSIHVFGGLQLDQFAPSNELYISLTFFVQTFSY